MKRKGLLAVLTVVTMLVASIAMATQTVNTCQTVSTATNVLARNLGRLSWSIVTTSGAATVYWRADGSAATVGGTASAPLVGGQSYAERKGEASQEAVSVVAKSGSVWVCAQETY